MQNAAALNSVDSFLIPAESWDLTNPLAVDLFPCVSYFAWQNFYNNKAAIFNHVFDKHKEAIITSVG